MTDEPFSTTRVRDGRKRVLGRHNKMLLPSLLSPTYAEKQERTKYRGPSLTVPHYVVHLLLYSQSPRLFLKDLVCGLETKALVGVSEGLYVRSRKEQPRKTLKFLS